MSVESFSAYNAIDASERRRHSGLLGSTAAAALGLFACLSPPLSLGQKIEGRLFPVMTDQSIPAASVTRIDRTLCWDWVRTKKRTPELLDLDVSLDIADGDAFAPEIFNAESGIPWHRGGALPAGHYETRFCTTVPASVGHDVPVRLRQTLLYSGFLGLWTLSVPLPSIVAN